MDIINVDKNAVRSIYRKRDENAHKGDFGYVALIGGSIRYSGAIRLSEMAASSLRTGAGVVKLATSKTVAMAIMPQILEATLFPLSEKDGFIVFRQEEIDELVYHTKAVAVGMGIGNNEETKELVAYLLRNYEGTLIIDADGLNALSLLLKENPDIIKSAKGKVVLTPHMQEFVRLAGQSIEGKRAFGPEMAENFAKENGCIVLLKGHTTYVSDGEVTYAVRKGTPGMATAGSGDVLSGIVASLCAQRPDSLTLAVAVAAYINGEAGEIAEKESNEVAMTSGDTAKHVKEAVVRLLED